MFQVSTRQALPWFHDHESMTMGLVRPHGTMVTMSASAGHHGAAKHGDAPFGGVVGGRDCDRKLMLVREEFHGVGATPGRRKACSGRPNASKDEPRAQFRVRPHSLVYARCRAPPR